MTQILWSITTKIRSTLGFYGTYNTILTLYLVYLFLDYVLLLHVKVCSMVSVAAMGDQKGNKTP